MNALIRILVIITSAISLISPAWADKKDKDHHKHEHHSHGKHKDKHGHDDEGNNYSSSATSEDTVQVLTQALVLQALQQNGIDTQWMRQQIEVQHMAVPHAQPLPPGIRKNLARGKPLPPGIAKKRLPPQMINTLPQYSGYEWTQVGTDVVLIQAGTQILVDVLENVLR